MYNIFEEMSWPQFQRLDGISRLSLNEQTQKYNQYLYELSEARHNFITYQNKGPKPGPFLLQEDGFYLLQENGYKIEIPAYA